MATAICDFVVGSPKSTSETPAVGRAWLLSTAKVERCSSQPTESRSFFGERVAGPGDLDGTVRRTSMVSAPLTDGSCDIRCYSGKNGALLHAVRCGPSEHPSWGIRRVVLRSRRSITTAARIRDGPGATHRRATRETDHAGSVRSDGLRDLFRRYRDRAPRRRRSRIARHGRTLGFDADPVAGALDATAPEAREAAYEVRVIAVGDMDSTACRI